MANQIRILFGIITKSHTELAIDEMHGLQDLGYHCDQFEYGANKNINSSIGRLFVVLLNAIKLLIKTYRFKPQYIYLNSRVEYIAGTRDFITIFLIKTLYYKRVRIILKSHGSDLEVLSTKRIFYSKIVFPYLKKNIHGWLFLSTEELKWIKSKSLLQSNRIFLVKNIVRINKFVRDPDFKKKLKIDNDYTVLLYVGRLIKEKGIHDVVEAYAEIKNDSKTILIIVGDGEEFDRVKEKINKSGISKHIILTGWVDEKEAAYFTSNSDMLIFPTYYPEGFPMVVFNSLAAGLAIVTTPTRAAIDYLEEPHNCIWVKPQSKSSTRSAISRLLKNQILMKDMRQNNKIKSALFTKDVVATELSAIIESIQTNQYNDKFLIAKNEMAETKHSYL